MSIINTDNIVNLDADTLTDNVKILEEKILNVNRGILALQFDVMNERKNAPRLKQMYTLRDNYEKNLRELKYG
jgi:hypothetical protein|tara:strand:+ start:1012 stop:1230 length:219 start_codon:yes stop_codon:yes gene_type:complete